jgi:hypothetical protein
MTGTEYKGKEAAMTNDKVQNARELLRIALDMLDECDALVSGALVAGALDALESASEDDARLSAPPVGIMALAVERGRPMPAGLHSCA